MPVLQKLATLIATALLKAIINWLKDPKNRGDIETATDFVIDKLTDAIPGQWDDRLLDGLAKRAGSLDPLAIANQVANEVLKHIPILGGR